MLRMVWLEISIRTEPVGGSEPWNRLREKLANFPAQGGRNIFAAWPNIDEHPGFRRELVITARQENRVVGGMAVLTGHLRLGESRLKTAFFYTPAVHPEYVKKGLGAKLLEHAWQTAAQHGFRLAWSSGHSIFEKKHGFVPLHSARNQCITIEKSALPACCHKSIARPIRLSDLSFVRMLHERDEQDAWGSILRTTGHFSFFWHTWKDCRIVSDLQGKMLGYYLCRIGPDSYLDILELSSLKEDYFSELFGQIRRHAGDAGKSSVRFFLPPAHAGLVFLSRSGCPLNVTTEKSSSRRGSAGVFALMNCADALEDMIPEWERRLNTLDFLGKTTKCTLVVARESGPWTIRSARGAVSIVPGMGANRVILDRDEMVSLLLGNISDGEWTAHRTSHLDQDAKALVKTLFLPRIPYIWHMDRPELLTGRN